MRAKKIMNQKTKDWVIGKSPTILIITLGFAFIAYSQGLASVEAMVLTIIGIFCPILVFIEVVGWILDGKISKSNSIILTINLLFSFLTFIFLADSDQRSFFLIMDAIFCVFILAYILIRRFFNKSV